MDPTIQFEVQIVSGVRNLLFDGEGMFPATLTGSGHVALQSMPIINLAEEIARYLPAVSGKVPDSIGTAAGSAAVGGIPGTPLGRRDDS